MKTSLAPLFILIALVASPTTAQSGSSLDTYSWTISDNASYPLSTSGTFTPGVRTLHLWLSCESLDIPGLRFAEFDLVTTSPNLILACTPVNGFVNQGTATSPKLAIDTCVQGPVLAAQLLVLSITPGNVCIESSSAVAEDCDGVERVIEWEGFEDGGGACFDGCVCDWYYDAPIPCVLPDGTCTMVQPWDYCPGGFIPPVCDCRNYEAPVSVVEDTWGRTKGAYR